MKSLRRHSKLALLVMISVMSGFTAAFAQSPAANPIPAATGPIPVTADSYPQMAANRTQDVVDLPKAGYVEEEFFVSGTANVYDWPADGRLIVKTANAPYTTRIMVRRPLTPARFSGTVIVEMLNNAARNYDQPFVWAISYPYFMEHGAAYVGITQTPQGIDSLKKFNPKRYASLSMANPAPGERCGPKNETSDSEEGLRWDIISQVGALLKSTAAVKPLAGFNVQYVYMSSHLGDVATYTNAVHSHANLASGKPVYDGYVIKNEENPARINRCSPAPPEGDPRTVTKNVSVPVIRFITQTDVTLTFKRRRPDSDEPGDRFRWYEIAAAPHMDKIYYQHLPVPEDQVKAGQPPSLANWPLPYACTPLIDLIDLPIMRYALNATFANLDRWVRTAVPAPRAEPIAVVNGGTPQASVETDQFGNAKGGVRSPYIDVPAATYIPTSPGPAVCRNFGRVLPFDWARLHAIYGTSKTYANKVAESVDLLVKERWLTESDGNRIKEAVGTSSPAVHTGSQQ
jgi:hypothetical protein